MEECLLPREDFSPKVCQGRWWVWPALRWTFLPKWTQKLLSCCPAVTSRAMESVQNKSLCSALALVQQMPWKQLLRKRKKEFSHPLNAFPLGLEGWQGFPAMPWYSYSIAHQGPEWNHKPISSRQANSSQMVTALVIQHNEESQLSREQPPSLPPWVSGSGFEKKALQPTLQLVFLEWLQWHRPQRQHQGSLYGDPSAL